MNRYMAKVNADHLPSVEPIDWEGRRLRVPKLRPREVHLPNRDGLPQIAPGDELWICTDTYGPGIVARAVVSHTQVSAVDLNIVLHCIEVIPNPIALNDFGRLGSGSRLISQLQRNRHPDLYLFDDDTYEEFENVVLDSMGPRSLPSKIDWRQIAIRNHAEARRQLASDRRIPLALRPVREGQRAFRDALMRLYRGRCVVTGCSIPSVVEAAHIVPWTGDPYLDRLENGLVLRRDIHGLFDAGLLGLDPQSRKVVIAEALSGSDYEKWNDKEVEHYAAYELVALRHALFAQPR